METGQETITVFFDNQWVIVSAITAIYTLVGGIYFSAIEYQLSLAWISDVVQFTMLPLLAIVTKLRGG